LQENDQQAVKFIEKHRADNLWGNLIELVVKHPDKKAMISDLLDAISGKVDPLIVIDKIPPETEIENLNMQLSRIINEYRVQVSLLSLELSLSLLFELLQNRS